MRVVFMGTPDIAATCLKKILDDGFRVVGVYTQPDRPKGRGMKLAVSPVKELAQSVGISVYQPQTFRDEEVVAQLCALQPDVIAVVAYGRILPQCVLDIPPKGCINVHASLLPQYRGSAPYQWAVLDGRSKTGVSVQFMSAGVDEGDVIAATETPIGENETAGQLLDRLAVLGADLLSRTLKDIQNGTATAVAQDPALATYAPMLGKELCPIDWTKTARQVHDHVRGLNPWPCATANLGGTNFKIHETVLTDGSGTPGQILGLTKTGLRVACGEGAVEIRILQAEGGKRMPAPDYFRGHPLED